MPENWVPLPLDRPLFKNLSEGAVVGHQTAIENGFINELGGHTRFPGLVPRVDLGSKGRVYLSDFDGDLIAATSQGQVHRIDKRFNETNITAVPVEGGRRVVFTKANNTDLLMAAGGPIVRLRAQMTELLSQAAPLSTHVGWIDGFTIAIETNTGFFHNSNANAPDQWDPLDTFAADGNGDNLTALLITPFRELLMFKTSETEQFERLPTGTIPFFRRWAIGDGVKAPYALCFADNATWTINAFTEFVRFSGQTAEARSQEIGKYIESLDDWTDAWIGGYPDNPLHIIGQKFLLIQVPNATNPYGTKGVTLIYDYRAKRFSELYGWDDSIGQPTRWPGWSHWKLWDRVFVGGEGVIYELVDGTYNNAGAVQRWLVRTAHIAQGEGLTIQRFRLQLRRGEGKGGDLTKPASIRVRCARDGKPFGSWVVRSLGVAGERAQFLQFGSFGTGATFRFEIACTDDAPVDLLKAEVITTPVGH